MLNKKQLNELKSLTTNSLKSISAADIDSVYNYKNLNNLKTQAYTPSSFLENKLQSAYNSLPCSVKYISTKVLELGSCAFRQWKAQHSHCQYLHGYQLKAKFWFECDTLDDKNWVVDFGGFKDLQNTLKSQFDHTLCVAKDDPLLDIFEFLDRKGGCSLRVMDSVGIEKTAEWCLRAAENFLASYTSNTVRVQQVEVFEHEDNSAIAQAPSGWSSCASDTKYLYI
jgi:6-pyruvoyltetrahydropterin/6-carboxytetrahydropterin synthase